MADITRLAGSGVYYLPRARWPAPGSHTRLVDAHTCRDAIGLLTEIGRSLDFPGWYGANFDALHDCLADSDCLPAGVLLIAGLDTLAAVAPADFAILMDVLASASDIRHEAGSALLILIDSAAAGLPLPPTS